jgi:alpha-L-rhamnosidase
MPNPRLVTILLSLVLLAASGCATPASFTPDQLTCDHRSNPAGIPDPTPRLAWRLSPTNSTERSTSLAAFQVIAASTHEALATGLPLLWDSGRVARTNSDIPLPTHITYAGPPLTSRDTVWWKVRTWDQDHRDSGWSDPASFTLGFLKQDDWTATWIGLDDQPAEPLTQQLRDEASALPWIREPGESARHERVAYFRAEFDLPDRPIKQAWFLGSVDMLGELRINGREIAPLARWELLRAIDITLAMAAGRNAIGIRVENHDGLNPAATGMCIVRYADGQEQRLPLNKSWTFAPSTPEGWDRPGFDDAQWSAAEESRAQPWGGNRNTEHFMFRAPYLRTTFSPAQGKTVRRATLYSTALGVYECRLNGARVGHAEFAPGWTEYSKRVEHQSYDVTSMVKPGPNALGAVLGDGWYAGLMGYTGRRHYYGESARFLAQLEIDYTDGTRNTIATGPDWRASFGPILHTDNYMGSEYDSRLEMPGWDAPDFDINAWKPVDTGLAQTHSARSADVTNRLRKLIKNNTLSILVSPAALGDPAYGVVKTLNVDYTLGGKPAQVSLPEGQTLTLPRLGEPADQPLTITNATFAEPPPSPPPPFLIEPVRADPVRRFEELPAKAITEPRPGHYVFDIGQNMVGWARLKITGVRGQRVTLRHAEMLNPDGTLYTSNLRGATATDFFTLKGGPETLEPPFTFHGFRYVEITGLTAPPTPEMVTGIVAHSAMTPAGTFTCSSPLINQLVENITWGQKGNYFEVPTDCPQRDERLGWTGDAQFFISTAAYNFDIAAFMSRWINTLAQDAQFDDGTFAHVAPKVNERGGSTAWGDAAIVCTHALYTTYADPRVIADNYNAFLRYMAWLDTKTIGNITRVGGFGDWLNLGDPTSPDLIDTAYRAHLCHLMAEMAAAIGKSDDAARFTAARDATIAAFRDRFLAPDGSLKESGQTGYALAFTMAGGLIPPELREQSAAQFAAAIDKKNGHLATGFIGTPRLLPALHNAGRDEYAARLLLNEDYPSWLYQVRLGATTMWERWDGWTPERGFSDVGMNSFNHYAFGSVGDYLYRHVAGIAPLAPGYAKILIAPTIVPGLTSAKAAYDSPAGRIESAWRVEPTSDAPGSAVRYTFDIAIPPNTAAEIRLPLPSTDATLAWVTESGRHLAEVPGVLSHSIENAGMSTSARYMSLMAGAGTYQFVIQP